MEEVNETLRKFFDNQLNSELDQKPTFSQEMAEKIRKTYEDLMKQKEEWLKERDKKESKS